MLRAGDGGALSLGAAEPAGLRLALHAGWIGALSATLALLVCGALTPGFDLARHPVALLGSDWAAHPALFRLAGLALPGAAVAALALALERRLGAATLGHAGRIGTGLLLIAGLAFALQAAFPLDPHDLDGPASQRHAAARAAALLAWLAAVPLLAWPLWRRARWRTTVLLGLGLALLVGIDLLWSLAILVPGERLPPGSAERVVLGAWLAWPAALGLRGLRRDAGR